MADTQPVFDKILDSCKHLFGGDELDVLLVDEQGMLQVAAYVGNARDAVMATFPAPVRLGAGPRHHRAARRALRRRPQRSRHAAGAAPHGQGGGLPLGRLRADAVGERGIGVVGVARSRGAFSDKEVALLQTFADQAVIAIQNARLFNETKEALERQTATAEVLKVISRSTFDLNAVLEVLIENATRLAGANQGFVFRFDGEFARMAFSYNARPAYTALIEANPISPGRGSLVGRTLLERRPVHIPDVLADQEFTWSEAQRLGGFRSMLGVPMLREGSIIGVIAVWSDAVRPFTERQIGLVSTFADQAVIAIENVRLFNETKEALERQTATAEILKVIAGSPTDVQPVFEVIVESAVRLCGARFGRVYRYDGC